eukprot:9485364-Pyramimonas_sp.AAC.1
MMTMTAMSMSWEMLPCSYGCGGLDRGVVAGQMFQIGFAMFYVIVAAALSALRAALVSLPRRRGAATHARARDSRRGAPPRA